MDKFLFQNVPLEIRSKYLGDNADALEQKSYMRPFDQSEVEQKKDDLTRLCIQIDNLELEKKEFMDNWKEKAKPVIEEKKMILTDLRQGAEFINDTCYKFVDRGEGMVGYYSPEGMLIEQRKAKPDEMQTTIFMKTGTNN